MVTTTNLNIYEDALRLYIGDFDTPYTYSTTRILTALVEGVRFLAPRWDRRYLIYGSGILISDDGTYKTVYTPDGNCTIPSTVQENDVFRNCNKIDSASVTTVLEIQDEAALILASAYLLRRSELTSSNIGQSWSTPDMSYSNIETSRTLRALIDSDLKAIELLYKSKLGTIQIGAFYPRFEIQIQSALDIANYYSGIALRN